MLYAGVVLAFLVLAYAFVPQVLSGKVVNQSDISGWQGMSHEMMEWNAAHPDDQTAWTESMFGGMPTTTIHASTKGDLIQPLYDFLLLGRRPATYLFISLLGAFLLMLSLGISPLVAFGGAVAVTFCSYNIQIIQVGHNTKMQALAFLPWVLASLVFTYRSLKKEGRGWLEGAFFGAAAFGITLSLQVKANHPQITYYLALLILIYAIVTLVAVLKDADRSRLLRRFAVSSALLLVLGVCGIGTNAIKLLPTYEYTPYSMRGGATASADGTKATKGLDLDYATAWSYGWEELPNLLIPNYNGGSSAGAVNPRKSETYALLKRAGQPNLKEVCKNLPLYWGPQPFTAGPMYMGAVTVFLFIFGLMYYRDRRQKWWLLASTVLAVLLALGSHLLWFTKLFYDFAPLYNKFRTVSMALVVLQFTLPVLGFLMLDSIVKSGESVKILRRRTVVATAVTAGICLVLALLQEVFGSFEAASDGGMQEVITDALRADRRSLMWADTFRSILLVAGAGTLLLWGLGTSKGASRRTVAAVLVAALVLLDLFAAGRRYLDADDFVTRRDFSSQFDKRPVDEMILADPDLSYRVLDLTVNVFNDSHPSYWHKNIGGYSPAKLQRYQEFITSSLNAEIGSIYKAVKGAATVSEAEDALPYCPGLAQMNTRYIIVGAENPPLRYRYAKGNAWFEDEEASGDRIEMTSYAPHRLGYRYSSSGGGRAVFSEVYYPEGWHLVLDGTTELPIDVWGGVLRCAHLPAGEHSLEMRFAPRSYSTGRAVSCGTSIVLLAVLLAAAAVYITERRKTRKSAVSPRRVPDDIHP